MNQKAVDALVIVQLLLQNSIFSIKHVGICSKTLSRLADKPAAD